MKLLLAALSVSVLLFIVGCKDNPVAPATSATPPPAPSVSQLNTRALELFGQGKDAVTAAKALHTEYPFGDDTLTAALYTAGYTPQDLAWALKVVFQELPRACERILLRLDVRITQDKAGEYVLTAYPDSLMRHPEDLIYFLQTLQSVDKAVIILSTVYNLAAPDVVRLLSSFGSDVTSIIKAVHLHFPSLGEKDFVSIMAQLKVSALDATRALKAISAQSTEKIATLLKDAGYEIVDVVKAIRMVYPVNTDQLATILDHQGYQLRDALSILSASACTLRDLAEALKSHYKQDASSAAECLKSLAPDLKSLGSALKDAYNLSDTELSSIVTRLGNGLPEIVAMLKGMGETAADAAAVLKAISTKSQSEAARLMRDGGYQIVDILAAIRTAYNSTDIQIADILDQLGYTLGDALATLKAAGYTFDEITGLLNAHYKQSPAQAAGCLKKLNADLPAIANALKNHYTITFADIALILKNLGGQLSDIVPILRGWGEPILQIITDLISIGFPKDDILHIFPPGFRFD